MQKSILALFLIMLSLLIIAPKSWTQELVCVEANGLDWCYNPNACGQACNDVCAADGRQPIADNEVWFQAQNSVDECRAISQAFGLGDTVILDTFEYACLEDTLMVPHGSGLNGPLFCSTIERCPEQHRTIMASQGEPCDSGRGARRSICPCEQPQVVSPIPTLSEWGLLAMASILGIIGFIVIRRRKVSA